MVGEGDTQVVEENGRSGGQHTDGQLRIMAEQQSETPVTDASKTLQEWPTVFNTVYCAPPPAQQRWIC